MPMKKLSCGAELWLNLWIKISLKLSWIMLFKTIEMESPKASMQVKTSSIKFFKCLGRGHIVSQCPTKKIMIMKGQDIYSSQEETTSCPSSSWTEDEVRGEESSEEVYLHEEGDLLMVRRLLGGQSCDLSQSQRENIFHTRCKNFR